MCVSANDVDIPATDDDDKEDVVNTYSFNTFLAIKVPIFYCILSTSLFNINTCVHNFINILFIEIQFIFLLY